jgi:hypothetical protein
MMKLIYLFVSQAFGDDTYSCPQVSEHFGGEGGWEFKYICDTTRTLETDIDPNNGDYIHLPYGDRAMFMNTDSYGDGNYDNFWVPKNVLGSSFNGGRMEFLVDVSEFGCSCNAQIKMTRVPGRDKDGNFFPGEGGDYYCDPKGANGNLCPELAIM